MNLDLDRSKWKRVKFGEVVQNINESVKDPSAAGIDRVIAMEHLEPNELEIRRWGDITDGTTFTRRVRPGQTLFGKRRAYQRKSAYAEFDGICSGDILVLKAVEATMLPQLLPFLVQSEGFYANAVGTSAGSLSPRTNWKDLAAYSFDLPPLDQQQRIADLLWAIEGERKACQRLSHSASQLLKARRIELMAHGLEYRAEEVFDIEIGRQRAPKYQMGDNPVLYLRSANVKPGLLDLSDVLKMDFSPTEIAKFGLQSDDILVTEGCGSPDEVGAPARWVDQMNEPVCFQNTLLRYRATSSVNAEWLWQWAQYAFESGLFKNVAAGTGILHIGLKRAKTMPVRVPSLSEQKRMAAELVSLTQGVDACEIRKKAAENLSSRVRRAALNS